MSTTGRSPDPSRRFSRRYDGYFDASRRGVSVAGHGTHSRDAAADYFFATYDVDVARLRETAAPFEVFEELLSDIMPRKKLFLMDTCESGDRDDDDDALTLANQRGLTSRSIRALVLDVGGSAGASAARPAPRTFLLDRDRYIFNDLARQSGAVVFSSSRGTEVSYESPAWQNGAFTAQMKATLASAKADPGGQGFVSTDHLRDAVAAGVANLTGDMQHPTIDRDNLEVRFGTCRPRETCRHLYARARTRAGAVFRSRSPSQNLGKNASGSRMRRAGTGRRAFGKAFGSSLAKPEPAM